MTSKLPSHAQAVVVGGGIAGASILYHLANMGWKDVILLERKQFTCGTTWHAAGLMGSYRPDATQARMVNRTRELYLELSAETGMETGFKQVGSISLAADKERLQEYKRGVDIASALNLEAHMMSPAEIVERYPLVNPDDLLGGMWMPLDGQINPVDATQMMLKAARSRGATALEDILVTGVEEKDGKVSAVVTDQGTIQTDIVINAAGLWAHEFGKMAGVNIPLHACEHFYVVTDKHPDIPKDLPVLREYSASAYFKEDAGSLLIGAFEKKAKPWGMKGIPDDFCFDELEEDWDHFMPILEAAMHRLPLLEEVGIRKFFNGPESFTPDDAFHMGEAPELGGYFMMAGFNSVGIQTSGGAAEVLADWIINGKPKAEVLVNDPRRNHPTQGNKSFLGERASETLGLLYDHHYPYRQFATGRGQRRSPIHSYLKEHNACFGNVAGYERPNWFAPAGVTPEYKYTFDRQNWFDYSAAEHKAVREAVGLLDLSSFGKIIVEGPDACALLNKVSTNQADVAVGRIVYTQWCNKHGGIEADVTMQRVATDRYQVVTPAATVFRELNWLKRHMEPEWNCGIVEVTSAEAVFAIMGPNSRALLQSLSPENFAHEAFPFGTVQTVDFAQIKLRAARITYVGELGWELHMSSEVAGHVFEALWEAGKAHDLALVGMHAMDSLRSEKGYRHFGHDIGEIDTPLEAGLGFATRWKKGDFIGRDVLLAQKESGVLPKRMLHFKLRNPEPLTYHGEPVMRDGEIVGYLNSGSYGHHLGASVGLAYVHHDTDVSEDWIASGSWSIRVEGIDYDADASSGPLYDPENAKIRC